MRMQVAADDKEMSCEAGTHFYNICFRSFAFQEQGIRSAAWVVMMKRTVGERHVTHSLPLLESMRWQ